MALVIVLMGTALSLGIFALANSMLTTNVVNRRSYAEQIDVNRHIEMAKGFITTKNIERVEAKKIVLHGQGGDSGDYFPIFELSDLQVCTPKDVGDVLSREIPLKADMAGGARTLRLQVFDANYRVSDVRFVPDAAFPPSLRPLNQVFNRDGNADDYEDEGEVEVPETSLVSGDIVISDHYRNYGAYLIRVEVLQEGSSTPLRRVEEAFFQVVEPK